MSLLFDKGYLYQENPITLIAQHAFRVKGDERCFDSLFRWLVFHGPRQYQGVDETYLVSLHWLLTSFLIRGGGMFGLSRLCIIVFSIFHYSASTERARLESEACCSGIVWLTQVAISQ